MEKKQKSVDGPYTNKLLNDKSLSRVKVLEEIDWPIERDSNKNQRGDVIIG